MTARGEILDLLQSAEVMAEAEIVDEVDSDHVGVALQDLSDEGVLVEHSLLGHETYYSLPENLGSAEIEQAADQKGVKEVAEEIVEESAILGDPKDATPGSHDIFEDLF